MPAARLLSLLTWAAVVHSVLAAVPNITTARGFVAEIWAEDLPNVRSLVYDKESGSVLALVRDLDQVIALSPGRGGRGVTRTVVVEGNGLGLNHGLVLHGGYIYASSADNVYRWPYDPPAGAPRASNAEPEIVVKEMGKIGESDTAAGHITRTLAARENDTILYISIGSIWNVDADSARARIRWVDLSDEIPEGGHKYSDLEVFADGLRNTVGLGFDTQGRLWGVENGADRLQRTDLGIDVFQDNPAEEVNVFDGPVGTHYGYPYCFSAYQLRNPDNTSDLQYLQQFSWPQGIDSNHPDFLQPYDDTWCQDPENNHPPAKGLPSHTAPLGLEFYTGQGCDEPGGFDCWMTADMFVALHGSWNRAVPDGYSVERVPFSKGQPSHTSEPIVWATDHETRCMTEEGSQAVPAHCFRPVNAIFLPNGQMLVSSDSTGMVVKVARDPKVPLQVPSDRRPPPPPLPRRPPPARPPPATMQPPPAVPTPMVPAPAGSVGVGEGGSGSGSTGAAGSGASGGGTSSVNGTGNSTAVRTSSAAGLGGCVGVATAWAVAVAALVWVAAVV